MYLAQFSSPKHGYVVFGEKTDVERLAGRGSLMYREVAIRVGKMG